MRLARNSAIVAVTMLLLSLTALSTGAAKERLDLGGQAITGHEVLDKAWHETWNGLKPWSGPEGNKIRQVMFSTAVSVPGGDFWVFMSEEIVQKKHSIASIYWHGDNPGGSFAASPPLNRRSVYAHSRRVLRNSGPVVAVVRPHGTSKYNWRQVSEIRLQIALVEYLSRTFGVKKFNLHGHSGGGLVAMAVAQERPELTATVALSSPKLAVWEHYMRHEGGVPDRYYSQYDPIDHIEKLSPEIPVLITYDLRDDVVKPGGLLPYTKKAEALGLKVRLVQVRNNDHPYHHTQWRLGIHLRKPENSDFRPREE